MMLWLKIVGGGWFLKVCICRVLVGLGIEGLSPKWGMVWFRVYRSYRKSRKSLLGGNLYQRPFVVSFEGKQLVGGRRWWGQRCLLSRSIQHQIFGGLCSLRLGYGRRRDKTMVILVRISLYRTLTNSVRKKFYGLTLSLS